MKNDTSKVQKDLENCHDVYKKQNDDQRKSLDSSEPVFDGYLFKRTSNAFKTWNRRWFTLQNNQLVYK